MNKSNLVLSRKTALACALAAAGLVAAAPAFADAEIDALKRELAEQKALIQQLLQGQAAQKQAVAKVEAQVASGTSKSAGSTAIPGVTFYGTADVNIASTNSGYGNKTSIGSGGMTASSLGVKGVRDLGNGLKAVGEVEAGISFTTGTAGNGAVTLGINNTAPSSGGLTGTGSQIFSRQAYAGLSGDSWGSVTVGRQYTGSYIAAATIAPAMGPGFFGSSGTFLPVIGGMPTRVNNSLVYRTPSMNGFSGWLTYTAGSENNVLNNTAVGATTTNDKAGQGWDAALIYRGGPLVAALTTWNIKNASFVTAGETDLADKKGWQIAANYNFGFAKLYATAVSGEISGGNYENVTKTLSKASGLSISAGIPFGKSTVYASYSKLDDKSLLNKDAHLVGLSYTYELYANTRLYASWARLTNDSASSYSLANGGDLVGNVAAPGFSPSGIMAGMNVSF